MDPAGFPRHPGYIGRLLPERGARVVLVSQDDEIQKIAASLDVTDIVLVSILPDAVESRISLSGQRIWQE